MRWRKERNPIATVCALAVIGMVALTAKRAIKKYHRIYEKYEFI